MGPCNRRHFLLSTCLIQTLTIIERQVFDFLGYMWAPIFANFFHIIFVIFGFYGAYLLSIKYVVTYLIWNILWMGWNSFLISFYLDLGKLDKNSDILNLGTGSVSWFEINGYGCKPVFPTNITSEDPFRPVRPEHVYDCLIDYPIIEVIHSGLQFLLSALAVIGATLIALKFSGENGRLSKANKKMKQRQSLYSIEFGPSTADTIRGSSRRLEDHMLNVGDDRSGEMSPKPMTPRRVKRRSVMTRGGTSRRSSHHNNSHHHTTNSNRSSVRSSRRKYHQNPIARLIDQQQNQHQNIKSFASFSNTENSNLKCVSAADIIVNNKTNSCSGVDLSGRSVIGVDNTISYDDSAKSHYYNNFSNNINPNGSDPVYYNANSTQFQKSRNLSNSPTIHDENIDYRQNCDDGGHFNPSYQHSTPNLANSTEQDYLYNNRPPSVRSSYSNFHGTRPLSSYNSTSENVFVGITGGIGNNNNSNGVNSINGGSIGQNLPQVTNIQSTINAGSIATVSTVSVAASQPQVPSYSRRSFSRKSIRSSTFLDNGPPAYNLNYHTPPDSETTM